MSAAPSLLLDVVGGLLLAACWTDVTAYRIPNWIPLVILALFPAFALASAMPPHQLLGNVTAFGVALAGAFALFAWNKLGGGDVKLFAAVALWAGWGHPLVYLVIFTAIFGGVISLFIVLCRWTPIGVMAGGFCRAHGWNFAIFDPAKKTAPYALAISAAWFALPFLPT
jgi:prepilin peptidase CpaA